MDPGLDLFRDTKGVSYKTATGSSTATRTRPPIADLDSLPWPAYHLFKMNKYTNLQPATDAIAGRAQLLHHDQPRLPLSLHLLLAEHHADQVARALVRERDRGMAAPGARTWARWRSACWTTAPTSASSAWCSWPTG